ncbi:MAG TPA: porin [Steroidobacteraceae bacterium]|nr:porin [Steroidobacteraceae bacterium]
MNRTHLIRAAIIAALGGISASPSYADDAALQAQVEALRAAITEQRAQLEAQAKLLEAQQAQLEALTRQLTQPKAPAQDAPKVTINNNRPTITSGDGRSSIAFRANVQIDGASYGESPAGPLGTDFRRGSVGGLPNRENTAARDMSNDLFVRRARIGIEGAIAKDWSYKFLAELGGSGTEGPARINDTWVAYSGFAPFTIQLGAFAPLANMDDSTSAEDIPFLERASASEIARSLAGADGRLGVAVKANGNRWMSSLALTTRTVGDAEVFDSQSAALGRVGFLVATGSDYNVHLGASGSYVFALADQGEGTTPRHPVRFRDRPEVRADGVRLIDTGNIDAEHVSVFGAELGANWKNLYLQGEHFWYDVTRPASGNLNDPSFTGYYLQGSWILTGENRRYNPVTGSFQAPRAKTPFSSTGGFGALEIAARFSRMDLNFEEGLDGTAAIPGSVRGGDQQIWTFGVNWYPNPNIKVMLDYLLIDVNRLNPAGPGNTQPFGPTPNTPPDGAQIGQALDVIALRTQFSF